MTNERKHRGEEIDIAILGGGPAGLKTALVLSRTKKKIIVFDTPEPPRNTASNGVHNFLALMVFYQWISVKSHGNKLTNTILQRFAKKK
jgi:predicted flavoprotein YhiN